VRGNVSRATSREGCVRQCAGPDLSLSSPPLPNPPPDPPILPLLHPHWNAEGSRAGGGLAAGHFHVCSLINFLCSFERPCAATTNTKQCGGGAGLAKLTSCSACRTLAAVHQVVGGDDRGGAVRSVPSALWHVGHAVWEDGVDNFSLGWPCTAARCGKSTPPLAGILSIRITPGISSGSAPWPPPQRGGSPASRRS
jgi:hypothetical protein